MRVGAFTLEELLFVCKEMRPRDWDEVSEVTDETPDMIAIRLWQRLADNKGMGWVLKLDDETPVAIFGGWKKWGQHWEGYFVATDEWEKIAWAGTRFLVRLLRYLRDRHNDATLEVYSKVEHVETHRWIERLGGHKDVTLANYGKSGCAFVRYLLI